MTAPITRLPRWQEWTLYLAIAGLLLSGALWLLFHYFVSGEGEFGRMTHPLEPWWLKIHGAFGMFALIALGTLVPNHIAKAWQRRRNRLTGSVNTVTFMVLVVTGYLLYYLGDDTWRDWASVAHWAVGFGLPVATLVHVVAGSRQRGSGSRARGQSVEIPPPATVGVATRQHLRAVRGGQRREG